MISFLSHVNTAVTRRIHLLLLLLLLLSTSEAIPVSGGGGGDQTPLNETLSTYDGE